MGELSQAVLEEPDCAGCEKGLQNCIHCADSPIHWAVINTVPYEAGGKKQDLVISAKHIVLKKK